MRPKLIQHIGDELAVLWDDGHETYLKLEHLRRHCPCATCQGEADVLGRVHKGPSPVLTADSFQLLSLQPVGNYGIQPNWKDGHHSGIYTFDSLRSLCGCDKCVKKTHVATE